MQAGILDHPSTHVPTTEAPAPAKPLTPAEQDALLLLAASTEKPSKVKAGGHTSVHGSPRAWSRGGNVD